MYLTKLFGSMRKYSEISAEGERIVKEWIISVKKSITK